MQKISLTVLDKIIEKCTDAEISFLIYISKRQDFLGVVRGIYYKDICGEDGEIGMCKQTFYNVVRSLEAKGIIEVSWINEKYWNFRIIDNTFRTYDKELFEIDQQKGYIDTNKDFLYTREFYDTKENVKKLTLQLLRFMNKENPYEKYKIKLDKLMKWVGISSKPVMLEYLETLRKWFIVNIKDDLVLVCLKEDNYKTKYTEKINYYIHKILDTCRKLKIKFSPEAMADTLQLLIQYSRNRLNSFILALCDAISLEGSLEPALINYHINKHIKVAREIKREKKAGEYGAGEKQPMKYKKPTFNNFTNRKYDTELLFKWLLIRDRNDVSQEEKDKVYQEFMRNGEIK